MDRDLERWLERIEEKLDRHSENFSSHIADEAVQLQRVSDAVSGAHRRIAAFEAERKDHKGWWLTLWGGVILLALERVFHYIVGGKNNP